MNKKEHKGQLIVTLKSLVQEFMDNKGITREQLSRAIGKSASELDIIFEDDIPPHYIMSSISEALGVPIEDMILAAEETYRIAYDSEDFDHNEEKNHPDLGYG